MVYTANRETMESVFEYEYLHCQYKPPRLWDHREFWQKQMLPTVRKATENQEILRMVNEAEDAIQNGWRLGIENLENKKLNTDTYPDDMMGEGAMIETGIQLIEQMIDGKQIPILSGEKAMIPLFTVPKKRDPLTGEVIKMEINQRWNPQWKRRNIDKRCNPG